MIWKTISGLLLFEVFFGEMLLKISSDNIQIRIGSTCKATEVDVKRKKSTMTPHRRTVSTYSKANLATSLVEHGKAAQKLKDSLKRTKSPMMPQKLARPRG